VNRDHKHKHISTKRYTKFCKWCQRREKLAAKKVRTA
jgi:hypothetical protein